MTGEKRPFSSAEDWEWVFETFDEDGKPHSKPQFFQASHYIDPRVVWADKRFAVLAGRAGDFGAFSLGICTMPTKDGGGAVVPGLARSVG